MSKEKEFKMIEKKLLSVKELAYYLSIGQTKARELLAKEDCPYVCRIDGRIFANKTILDKVVDENTGRNI